MSADSSFPTWPSLPKQAGSPKTLAAQNKIMHQRDKCTHGSAGNPNSGNVPQTETNAIWSTSVYQGMV